MSKMNSNAVMNEMNDTMKHMDSTMSSMTTGLTDAELRATPIEVNVTNQLATESTVSQLLKPMDTLNSINSVNIIGVVDTVLHCNVSNFPTMQTVSGAVTVSNAVAISNPSLNVNTGLNPLTDSQLRQSPIPITGNVNATFTSNPDDLSFILISTATTNANVLKNSAGTLSNIKLNLDVDTGLFAGIKYSYLKIYDKATTPTSSDTPKLLFKLSNGADFTLQSTNGIKFNNGISIRITRNIAFNDNTAIGVNEVIGSFIFD